jgi:hypothetical protein
MPALAATGGNRPIAPTELGLLRRSDPGRALACQLPGLPLDPREGEGSRARRQAVGRNRE